MCLQCQFSVGLRWAVHRYKIASNWAKNWHRRRMSRLNFVPIRSDPRIIFLSGNQPLSHASDSDYVKPCKHEHDLACDRCNLFPAAVHEIESIFGDDDIPQDEKEEMKFIVTQAKKNIEAWKAHILRSVNQDQARLDTLDKIDHASVLVILDWAMKFIPRRYRESQTDWFGKRGISWHISVATRKVGGNLQNLTLVSSYILALERVLIPD